MGKSNNANKINLKKEVAEGEVFFCIKRMVSRKVLTVEIRRKQNQLTIGSKQYAEDNVFVFKSQFPSTLKPLFEAEFSGLGD